jgi:hypothetical protein
VSGNTLHVYVRGVPPNRPGRTRQTHPVDETFRNVSANRVVFHGAERDITAELTGGPGGGPGGGTGNPRQIALLADRIVGEYQRSLNIRGTRGQLWLDTRRDYRPGEIDLLSQFMSLNSAAEVYSQVVGRVNDEDAVSGAAESVVRQARFVSRLLRRNTNLNLSRSLQDSWNQLSEELKQITIVSSDLDTDIERIR